MLKKKEASIVSPNHCKEIDLGGGGFAAPCGISLVKPCAQNIQNLRFHRIAAAFIEPKRIEESGKARLFLIAAKRIRVADRTVGKPHRGAGHCCLTNIEGSAATADRSEARRVGK